MSFPEQNELHVQECNDTVYICFVLQIHYSNLFYFKCSITNIMLLSHPENIYRLFVSCGIAYIRLMLLLLGFSHLWTTFVLPM